MTKRLIMTIGAVSIATALGSSSFIFGCRAVRLGNPAGANGIEIGLLLSIAVGVWGIFLLVLLGMPGKG